MQLKKTNKSLILLLSLLLIGTPTNSKASQTHASSNTKKIVIPMLAFTFLSNRLINLSDTKQSMSLFGTIHKLNVRPDKLTQDEMKGLNEYVKQETLQLGQELPLLKDDKAFQSKQNTYQQLTSLQQQLALLHKASFPQTIHRSGELIIPANGKCLYTSIILGYLLPVVNNQKAFDQRLRMIMDKQKLPITNKQFANHYNDLDYLDSNPAFQQIINALLKQIGIKPGTWGGPKEIRLIAEKLNINIQEYTPNPDSPKQLIKGDLTSPKNWINAPEATLHVVQDTPLKGELVNPDNDLDLQQGQISSLQGLQNRHHYRLYYTDRLPQPMPKAPTNEDNRSEQPQQQHTNQEKAKHTAKVLHTKPPLSSNQPEPQPLQKKETSNRNKPQQQHTDQENPKHTSILPDNVPQPKPSLPDLLKTHYKAQNQIPGLLGDKPQPLESCYIHLAMLTEEEHKVKKEKFLNKEDDPQEEKSWSKSMDYGLLHKVQKPIKLEDLWKPEENQQNPPRHVVVTGEAGTGKSTLSQYIAYQWAKGSLWQDRFHWMLQLPLRKVRDLSDQQSSHNQIATALGIPNFQGEDLQHLLQQKQPGLLILDGYDEVAIEVQKENSHLAQWLQPCFDNKDNLSIILTTRPGPHCPYVKQPRDLRVLGFQQQDIDRYVNTYFTPEQPQDNNQKPGTSKKATALLQVMQQNPTLKLLSHTPLYLRLLCILAKQQGANALSKCSTPQLYEQIIAQFLCYNLARHNNQPPTDEEQDLVFKTYGLELMYLGELAFEGMRNSQAVLPVNLQKKLLKQLRNSHPRNMATEPEHWTRIASLGLLQGYTCSSPRANLPTYFPHLTIQEWLAAHYLVTALYDSQHKDHHTAKAIINQDKYAPRYQVMLPFVAGICYQHIRSKIDPQGKGLTAFWSLLNAQPCELIGIHHAMLIARCLEACCADTSSTMPNKLQNRHKNLIKQVAAWLQALLDYPFDFKDVRWLGNVLLPGLADVLQAGLQGCPILLGHQLITQHVKPTWPKLSLEGGPHNIRTKRWYTRLAKIKTLLKLPLSHPTAKYLSTYLGQALQHQCKYVRIASARALPGVLKALEPQDLKGFINPLIGALKDKDLYVRIASARALSSVLGLLESQDRKACIIPFIGALKDTNEDVRRAAAGALVSVLGMLDPQDRKDLIPGFIGALKDKYSDVRSAAAGALVSVLGSLQPEDRKAFIIGALKDKDCRVRSAAADELLSVLQNLAPQDRKAFIIGALKDKDCRVRRASARALPGVLQALEPQDLKGFINPLIGALKDKNCRVREAAVGALPGVLKALESQDRKALMMPFIGALKDKDCRVRRASARALPGVLQALEPQDLKGFINPLIGALKDKNCRVREAAVGALPGVLKALESQDRKALMMPFIGALKDEYVDCHGHYPVREAAVGALASVLGDLEPEDLKGFINPLIGALKDKDCRVRRASARALPGVLQALEPQDRKACINPFIGVLKDTKKWMVRETADALVSVLGMLESQDCKSFIIGALKDKDSSVRFAALRVLAGVLKALEFQDRKACIKPFIGALKDKYSDVRSAAAYALGEMSALLEYQDRKAFIIRALKDKYSSVRGEALGALASVLRFLEPQDRKAFITPFINALKDTKKYVRGAAAEALPGVLQALEPQDRKAFINPFIGALKDNDSDVRQLAAGALASVLGTLEPQDRKAFINPFIGALEDKSIGVRFASAPALPGVIKALEPQDCKALIIAALKIKDYDVQGRAACALLSVLKVLDPQAVINLFIGVLKIMDCKVRDKVACALVGVLKALAPQDRKDLIKPFIGALKDKDYHVRSGTARALQKIGDKVWQSGLQYQLQTKPQQQDMEDALKAWAYLLLRGSVLVCFSSAKQNKLPSYKLCIEALQKQANTWGWPVHGYDAKPLPDDFNPNLPKLPAITIHPPLAHTPLHEAAKTGNVQALEELWKKNDYSHEHLNNQHNQDRLTPLLCALQHKKWKKAQWLIDQGAWLDVADKYGQSPLQKIITLRHWSQHKEALALIKHLLQKRTFFPKKRIDDKVKYVIEQGLDKETKARKLSAQKTYHKHLCTAVTDLLGEDVKDFQQVLLKRCDVYKATSQNIEKEKRENIDKEIDYTKGLGTRDFLPYRIALLFDVLVNLQQGDFTNKLPEKSKEETYKPKKIYEAGLEELQTQLTTFWANKLMEMIFTLRFDLKPEQVKNCYQAWASGIIHCLPNLTLPQEMSLALSHKGHCIYVSLTHTSTHYIVRIDNRWINTAPKKSHPITQKTFYEKQMDALKPYAVAYFPVSAWNQHQSWLLQYIMMAGQVNGQYASQVIKHLYQTKEQEQTPPRQGNKPQWIKDWPWRPKQTTAQNCFMRSHNVGYRIRLGNELYEWFKETSCDSHLLKKKFLQKQIPSSHKKDLKSSQNLLKGNFHDDEKTKEDSPQPQPKKTSHKLVRQDNTKHTSSKKLPSHQGVMLRFAKQLKVPYDAVYSGIAAEQALVHYANITRNQTGARLGRDRHTGETLFRLNLTYDEATLLVNYYKQRHPHAIKKAKMLDKQWVRITFDTARLYHEIIPTLSLRQQKARKTGYNKQQGYGHQVMNTNKKPQSEDTKYISPKKSKFKKSSPKPTTSSKKLPSHQEVMKRFAKTLKVNYDAVYSGIAAEQSLVRYAGVSQTQTGAMFRRDSQTGYTWFKLRLNSYEANLFMDHYQTLHPDAIKKRTTLGNDWVRIVFDTARLYHEIIPNLV